MANYIKVDGANYKIQGKGALGGIATVQMPNIASDQTYTFPSIGGQLALEGENKLSAGVGDKPTITDNLDGTLTVGNDGTYYLYSDATGESVIDSYTINGATYTPTDGVLSYIVANYNSGTPALQLITNVSLINETTIIPVRTIYRDGTDLHLVDWDSLGWALVNKIHQSIVKTQRVRRESGLSLSEDTGRKIICSAGRVWVGAVPKDLDAIDSSADPTTLFYHSSGNWTSTTITAYNNTQYDNGTDLATLTNNSYGVSFVYRCVSDTHGDHTYVVLGQGDYDLNEAQAAQPPSSLPPLIAAMGVLVGRIIVQKSAATATQIDSAFVSTFSGTGAVDHNATTGLQGGTAAEYYHLTSAQHTGLTALYAGTGTLAIPDANLSVVGSADATKIAKFEVDGFTTSTTRTVTLPDANIVAAGSAVALTSGRVPTATTGGLLTDTFLASTVSGNTATFAGAMGASRTFTLPDASITVAGSATALTATRVPFVTTGGLLTDSTAITYASNQLYLADTTASNSTTSGALRVAGGVGVAGAAYVGGALRNTATTASTSTTSGAFVCSGGVGIAGAVFIGGTVTAASFSGPCNGLLLTGLTATTPIPLLETDNVRLALAKLDARAVPSVVTDGASTQFSWAGGGIWRKSNLGTDKLLSTARTNLVAYSQDFDTAAWLKTNVTVSTEAIAAPDGTTTADKIVETAAGGGHRVTNNLAGAVFTDSTTYILSTYAKAGERSVVRLRMLLKDGGYAMGWFNLSTGAWDLLEGVSTTYASLLTGGWWRIGIACNIKAGATAPAAAIGIVKDGVDSYTGDGTSGLYLWGAQVEQGTTATRYIPTTSAAVTVTDYSAANSIVTLAAAPTAGDVLYGVSRHPSLEAHTTITGNTTLDATYHNVLCNSASALTVTLPAAASNSGRVYVIKNINTGVVTVDGNASETIDGETTYALTQYQSIKILCNGSNWFIVT